jgi:CubicO group peptidase (beta-lactamase class C family)
VKPQGACVLAQLVGALLLAVALPSPAAAQPGAPTNLRQTVRGAEVHLAWDAPVGGALQYRLEAGSAPMLADLATFVLAATNTTVQSVPNGSYFVRVRTIDAGVLSAPSNEVIVVVAPPGPPGGLVGTAHGAAVSLAWNAPTTGGTVEFYVLEAGSRPGLGDLARLSVSTTAFVTGGVPPRVYFVRVRAASSAGLSAPSNEVELVVGDPLPGPPAGLTVTLAGPNQVGLAWQAPQSGGAATSYRLEVGTGPGLSDLAVLTLGNVLSFATTAPERVYFVRVRALNASGAGPASDETVANVYGLRNGIPVSGTPVAALGPFDEAMTAFMASRGIGAGVLAISLGAGAGGSVLFERGYGWHDRARSSPLRPDTPFRIASVVKPMTASLINRLAAAGVIAVSDYVFCVGSNRPCHLSVPAWGTPDPRLGSITIEHLLAHRAGWDRAISGDPMFMLHLVATELGVPSPVAKGDIVRWLAGRPLDFAPGTREAYSNVGYLILGRVAEQVTGQPLEFLLQQGLFAALGIGSAEVYTGRSLPGDRDPREPVYEDPFVTASLFPPYAVVPWPDGGLLIEAFEAHGGIVATSRALARFLSAYWINGQPRHGGTQTWTFYGSMPGTLAMARQLPGGINLAVAFNTRRDQHGLEVAGEDVRLVLEAAAGLVHWDAAGAGSTFND